MIQYWKHIIYVEEQQQRRWHGVEQIRHGCVKGDSRHIFWMWKFEEYVNYFIWHLFLCMHENNTIIRTSAYKIWGPFQNILNKSSRW